MNAKDQRIGTEIAHGAEDGIKDGMNNQLTIVFFECLQLLSRPCSLPRKYSGLQFDRRRMQRLSGTIPRVFFVRVEIG